MIYKLILFITLLITSFTTNSQSIEVPDSIKNELIEKTFYYAGVSLDTIAFKIAYPINYDSTKKYPVFLCLSGGNQSEAIVNYCYAVWFRSRYFKNYITILPINKKHKNLKGYTTNEIELTIKSIKSHFKVTNKDWIIAGTSNGGVATYNFVASNPALFKALVVMPGAIPKNRVIDENWKHLSCIIAYGDKDDKEWITSSNEAKVILENKVKKVSVVVLKDQEHILPLGYNINIVYDTYFKK